MSIKIEVTGGSIGEVADKLLAIGHSLQGAAATFNPVMPEIEAQEPAEPVKTKTRAKKSAEKEPVGNDPAETAADPSPPTTSEEATSSASAATTTPSEPALDFDRDVGPVVVEAVTTHGREAVVAILGEFGAERASEVPEAQWAELVEKLKAL